VSNSCQSFKLLWPLSPYIYKIFKKISYYLYYIYGHAENDGEIKWQTGYIATKERGAECTVRVKSEAEIRVRSSEIKCSNIWDVIYRFIKNVKKPSTLVSNFYITIHKNNRNKPNGVISGNIRKSLILCYSTLGPEGRGLFPNCVTGIFHWHNPSGLTMIPEAT
jgi:hypothetical protein